MKRIGKKEAAQELKKYGIFVPEDKIGDEHYALIEKYSSKTVASRIKEEYSDKARSGECPICFSSLEESLVCTNCGAEYLEEDHEIKYREGTCTLEGGRFTILSNLRPALKTEIHRDFAARVFKDECPLCFGKLGDGHCKDCGAAFTREREKIYYIEGTCTQFKSNATKMRMMRKK